MTIMIRLGRQVVGVMILLAASVSDSNGQSAKPDKDKSALANRVQGILKENCHRCHGLEGSNEGGLNFILSLDKLATGEKYVASGKPDESVLLERITDATSPMPPRGEKPRPTAEDIETIRKWIEAGAPHVETEAKRDFVTDAQIVAAIAKDLESAPERTRRFYRYFTLTHLYNAGFSEDELQTYRLALGKLTNSLSWNRRLSIPVVIDRQRTVFRFDLRDFNWSERIWTSIVERNPYGYVVSSSTATRCYEATQCETPWIRADWFVQAASRPPLYHEILQIPATDLELEQMVRVNVRDNIEQEKVARAAFGRSGVSRNNRLIERHESPYGAYWKSYDFAGNVGRQNLFSFPLGPGEEQNHFTHDGGEILFHLPNGMLGFMLTDAVGKRIDKGPTSIVSDPRRPDRAVINGLSCMSCHFGGMISKQDEVLKHVVSNKKSFPEADTIVALYPPADRFDDFLKLDTERFRQACEELKLTRLTKTGEPVSNMAERFETDLDLVLAAAELGMSAARLVSLLDQVPDLGRTLGALKVPGGSLKRDTFVDLFQECVRAFDLGRVVDGSTPVSAGGSTALVLTTPRSMSMIAPDIKSGEVRRFETQPGWPGMAVAFSPDGTLIALGKLDSRVLVWNLQNSEVVLDVRLEKAGTIIQAVAFSPDSKRLLSGGHDKTISVWDLTKPGVRLELTRFSKHLSPILQIVVCPDNRHVVSLGDDGTLRLWKMENGAEVHAFPGTRLPASRLWVSKDSRECLVFDGRVIRQVDLKSKREEQIKSPARLLGRGLVFSNDGLLVAESSGQEISIWELKKGTSIGKTERGSNALSGDLAFSPDGKRIAAVAGSSVVVFDIKSWKQISNFEHRCITLRGLTFSPDSHHVAGAGADGVLHVWRIGETKNARP
jgi:WD40 repeat protein/mono/diheme cytochrome c family protein